MHIAPNPSYTPLSGDFTSPPQCWDPVPFKKTSDKSVIKTKFIFRRKDGTSDADIFKARLVAQGFSQVEGVDFNETFSGVVDKVTLRIVLHFIASMDFKCIKFDVSTAFLNARLEEDNIFISLPSEVFPDSNGKVFRLRRALYGLKQSPRCWQKEISATLATIGFTACEKDPCVFVLTADGVLKAVLGIHVDDGILGASTSDLMNQIIRLLVSAYKITISPEPGIYIAIEIEWQRANSAVLLRQTKYIEKLVRKFEIDANRNVKLPMDPNRQLQKRAESEPLCE